MLVEMIAERKKFFAAQIAAEQRSKPPTKTQIRNRMCTNLKNMGGYKHNQLKGRSYEEIQKFFDKAYKQKIDEQVEAEKDDDQEEAEMKKHIKIVKDDEVAINAIPLATKRPMIVEYKIIKEGKFGYFQLISADGSSKRYLSMIKMLQNIDREDLENLWKLVKAKHGNTRPEDDYERVLCGDLKVIFEPDIKSEVWRNLQGYKVTIWKLFDTWRTLKINEMLRKKKAKIEAKRIAEEEEAAKDKEEEEETEDNVDVMEKDVEDEEAKSDDEEANLLEKEASEQADNEEGAKENDGVNQFFNNIQIMSFLNTTKRSNKNQVGKGLTKIVVDESLLEMNKEAKKKKREEQSEKKRKLEQKKKEKQVADSLLDIHKEAKRKKKQDELENKRELEEEMKAKEETKKTNTQQKEEA
ncbi:hypothetical protein Tco_0793843 [Tanacetum coccineum]